MAKKQAADAVVDAAPDTQGQITVPLDGRDYVLRPSYEAIVAIERQLGLSLTAIAEKAGMMRLTIVESAVIVSECMRAYGKANPDDPLATDYRGAKPENIERRIYETGQLTVGRKLIPMLFLAITGGYTAEGEAKATS